MLSDYGSLLNL
jgi:hypothetical protein